MSGQVLRTLSPGGRQDRQGTEYDGIIIGAETVPTGSSKARMHP